MSSNERAEAPFRDICRLHDALRSLLVSRSPEEIFARLAEQAGSLTEAAHARVFHYDDQWKELYVPGDPDKGGMRFRIDVSLAGWVVRYGVPWRGTDLRRDPHFVKEIDSPDGSVPRSALIVPIAVEGGEIIGVLAAFNRAHGAFTEEDEVLLSMLAEEAALAGALLRRADADRQLAFSFARSFGDAVDAKHPLTAGHADRVRRYAAALARAAGLDESQVQTVALAGSLHNIGRLEMSPRNAVGELISAREIENFRTHFYFSDAIVKGVSFPDDLAGVPEIILKHTEHLDGTGAPHGLTADQIPIGARILAIANYFDKLASGRGDIPPDPEAAIERLRRRAGDWLDPRLVELFIERKCYDIEKRRWPRVDYTTPVDVTPIQTDGAEGETVETDAVDVSEGGIMFKSKTPMEPFLLLRLRIHLPNSKVEALGRVARALKQEDGTWHIGAHLVWIEGKE
jgi:HD-GYP domain-containing protein (c-di-GMP phosphodiesterase class II)